MRFKAGDKVRVKKFKKRPLGWNCEGEMDHLMGKVVKIKCVSSPTRGVYGVYDSKNDCDWVFREDDLEPVNETIVIYRKDREVIAVDKVTGDKAIARCNPADEYDFHIGAKLAFDRLMNGNKENITVEDMRKRLDSYCRNRSCGDCKLKSTTCRCGLGVHFMTKDDAGNYTMSNREIEDAFNIIFGTSIKEVKRRAKKGEYVKIVGAVSPHRKCKNGDILKIVDVSAKYVRYGYGIGEILYDSEYVVLEGYKPEKEDEPKEPHKFKVGDIVKGNSKSDRRYNITNSNMTRGKVTRVTGGTITIEVLEHKTNLGKAGIKYDVDPKCFDLVEESPKLYNGKIVFTKGDNIFKTGHIYEVKDGRINTEYEQVPGEKPLKDIEDAKDYFTGNRDGKRKRKRGWSPYTLELMEVKED